MASSPEYPDLAWMPPASYSTGRPGGPPRFIVVHYTAGAEGNAAAENGAAYDQRRGDGTSAHYHVDSDSVVQCVRTTDRAHSALYHGNLWGIQYELAGTRQSRAQWLDSVSRETIRNAARQMARDMIRYNIPNVRTTDVRNGAARGITAHSDWTYGWPEDGGDHIDPGPEFPWDVLTSDIAGFLKGGGGGGGDMSDAEVNKILTEVGRLYERTMIGRASNDAPDFRIANLVGIDGKVGAVTAKVDALATKVAELAARPPVDIQDPDFVNALARAVVRELARPNG